METTKKQSIIARFFKRKTVTIFLVLLAMCIVLSIINDSFLNYENLASVSRAISYTAIMAIGELLVILICGIDLSVGAVCGMSAVTSALLISRAGWTLGPAIIVAIFVGMSSGLLNGMLVVKLKLPPFIATMGTTQIIKSIALLLTDGKPVLGLGSDFLTIGQGRVFYIPISVWILIVFIAAFSLFLNKTVTGRRMYALGGGEEAARFSGVNTKWLRILAYTISGTLAAVSGVILCARMGSAQATTGAGYEMDAIASCVIGGTSMAGGEGNISGTIIGASIMCVIRNALVMLAVSTYLQSMIIGIIILVAVTIDQLRRASANKVTKTIITEAAAERHVNG